jgi:D-alanyl-D-alanine carboxypeptidase/D-alanyl-D-alanine carboxypeptidase (penicillin-binding protein 5/6)
MRYLCASLNIAATDRGNAVIAQSIPRACLPRRAAVALAVLAMTCAAGSAYAGYAAIVVDGNSGKVLEAVNPDQENIPASLAKMMTLYLTFQSLQNGKLKLEQTLPVSAAAAGKAPTKLGLRAGQSISVRDCVLGMIVKSANDAATVVAERLGGSEANFANLMNAQASRLGMSGTRFGNASGLPNSENRTTARDMATLAQALYRDYPQYTSFFAAREFSFRGRVERGHNNLMRRYAGMDGLKTGYTDASGFNLASTAIRSGQRLFAIVLGGQTAGSRDAEMARLLDKGFEQEPAPAKRVAKADAKGSGTTKLLAALSPISSAEAAETVLAKAQARCAATPRHVVASKTCKPQSSASRTRAKAASRSTAQRSFAQKSRSKSKKPGPAVARERD